MSKLIIASAIFIVIVAATPFIVFYTDKTISSMKIHIENKSVTYELSREELKQKNTLSK